MNPLTHCKKIRILPLLIAPALFVFAVVTALPVGAAPHVRTDRHGASRAQPEPGGAIR
jgi:hypothetical protein